MNSTMKKLVVVLLACAIFGGPTAFADEATKSAKIEEMLKLTNANQMLNQMFGQMKGMVHAQMSKVDIPPDKRQQAEQMEQQILQLVQDSLSWEKLKPKMIEIYAATFTEEEIDGILNFYKSPAGQAMLQKMPQLMQRSIAMTQEASQDLMPQIQKMMDELKAQEKNGAASSPPQ
jgi:uncharacterized protein